MTIEKLRRRRCGGCGDLKDVIPGVWKIVKYPDAKRPKIVCGGCAAEAQAKGYTVASYNKEY